MKEKFIQTNKQTNKGDSPVNFLCSNNRWGVASGLKGESSQNLSSMTSITLTYPFREIEFTEGRIQQVLSFTDKGLQIKTRNLQSVKKSIYQLQGIVTKWYSRSLKADSRGRISYPAALNFARKPED